MFWFVRLNEQSSKKIVEIPSVLNTTGARSSLKHSLAANRDESITLPLEHLLTRAQGSACICQLQESVCLTGRITPQLLDLVYSGGHEPQMDTMGCEVRTIRDFPNPSSAFWHVPWFLRLWGTKPQLISVEDAKLSLARSIFSIKTSGISY